MRKLLFRGKHVTTGKWIIGNSIKFTEGEPTLISSVDSVDSFDHYLVDPETVGQYWRTADEQQLFDGDIFDVIVATERNTTYSVRFVIAYHEDEACFQLTNIEDFNSTLWNFTKHAFAPNADWWNDKGKKIKIVGNIHENPELVSQWFICIRTYTDPYMGYSIVDEGDMLKWGSFDRGLRQYYRLATPQEVIENQKLLKK